MKKKSQNSLLNEIQNYRFSLYAAGTTFMALILIRLSVENWIGRFEPRSFDFYFYEAIHTTSFFFLLFIICVLLTTKIAKIPHTQSIIIFLFGFIFIIFPPILDWLISLIFFDSVEFMSYYLFDSFDGLAKSFVTFFGDKPRDGITYGTRIMIALSLLLMSTVTYLKTKKISRTFLIILIAYIAFFILSALPSIITFLFSDIHFISTGSDVAGFIASPTKILGNQINSPFNSINVKMSLVYLLTSICVSLFIIYKTRREKTIALIKNIRPIQSIYHLGLLFIGIGIAIIFSNAIILSSFFTTIALILLSIAIIFAWYATVILNDCVDQDIDRISNQHRPLITKVIDEKTYAHIGIFLTFFSIIIVAAINVHAAFLLISYHALSFLYNTRPLRLKRFPFIATLLAAIASFFIVAIGFVTVSPQHSLEGFPPHIALLLIIAYTISLPIKDLKDIAGDKKNNIYTIPVIFGEKIGRLIIAVGIFVSFILSIFTLNNFSLFFPALLAGSLCFWILTGHQKERFIFSPLSTISLVFFIVFIYGTILAASLIF